ncbi:hypothetical protein [Micromonospora sp. WMMD710]|uniref:hypothetical protein n=1 Tax=Micromonospora sp. WMMD710 TaxID=3016085 RepID=UPI002415FB48|nr:hypothetical protein [Micromonospora sp. WMMD710]MDG4760319.1 hypothetical protein [Micromonospora sp. WMMD710]
MNELTARLDALRGSGKRKGLDARAIAALTGNPACHRRALLDAAGINKSDLAAAIDFPMPADQSQFAITRGNSFEAQVKANGCAQLLTLLRAVLGFTLPEVSYDDLKSVGGNDSFSVRHRHTAQVLIRAAALSDEAGTFFDGPVLELDVAGYKVHLEPDLVAFRANGKFHVVEIKSFAIIDGQAADSSVAAAEVQAAVYVHAMRELLRSRGLDEGMVSSHAVLVCPKDFTNRPVAVKIDVTNQVAAVRRQLTRMRRLDSIVADVSRGATLDRWRDQDQLDLRPAAELIRALREVQAHYVPQCFRVCELAKFCRNDERGSTAALGRQVRGELGGLESVAEAVGLAMGVRRPAADQVEQAQMLQLANSYRAAALGGAA